MKSFLFFILNCLVISPIAAQQNTISTFKSKSTRLNTLPFFADTPAPAVASRIDWTSEMEADKTVSSPNFIAKACVTTAKPVDHYTLFLNDKLQLAERGLTVEKDKDCPQAFSQPVELREGENRLKLVAYLKGGGDVMAPLVVTYKKPPVLALEKRLALVIGNGDYGNSNKLANPVNDAADIAVALKKLGFDVMQFTNLDKRGMLEAINSFGDKLRDYQVGLFYYAGHGVQSRGLNYLVPLDAKPQSDNEIEFDCLRADRILVKMEDARTRTNIVVLDACRNAPFERRWSRGGDDNGLATMDAPIGSVIAYATSPGKTAADGNGRNGLYTAALLKALQTPNQTIIQLFQQVRAEVVKESNRKQIPWESTSLTGDFYFQRK